LALSPRFTLAKAFDVPALSHLRDISYAWALAPLLIWVLVAYVRLHARTSKSARKQDLQDFYVSVGPIITRQLPRDISESDLEKYTDEADLWVNSCASYINQEMGVAARERFLDRTGMAAASYSGAINDRHNTIIQNLTRFRKNLLVLIEGGAWD
jgi:hypothetical protein